MEKSNLDLTVISMLHLADGIQYRLVGATANGYGEAQMVQPSLEDGYIWLMKNTGHEVDVAER